MNLRRLYIGNNFSKGRSRGVTLVELLLVTALMSVVSLAMYAVFNSGMKIWQRVNRQIPEEDLNIFFERFTLDLKNSFRFSGINFSGEGERLEFAALAALAEERPVWGAAVSSDGRNKMTVGKVIYLYNPGAKIIQRTLLDFSQIYNEDDGAPRELLGNVEALKFQYYRYDGEKKEYVWQDEWVEEGLPEAVRIELDLPDGRAVNKFIKTVSIPAGG